MIQKQASVLILIAAQCDEEFVVRCVCQIRQKGISAALVGLYPGPITGAHGVWLRPDLNLADMELTLHNRAPCILVLPGPHECTMKLLFNPRVHELIEATFQAGGLVAAVSPKTRELLARSGLAVPEEGANGFLFQEHLTAGEFIDHLVMHMEFLSERTAV
jgi:protein deglycase